jgi:hypothetical protein
MAHTPADPRDVRLGTDTETGEAVRLRYKDRDLGVTIVGEPGTGKSTIVENLVLSDLANGTPGMVLDPHGPLAEGIIRRTTPEQAEKIILLEATSDPDDAEDDQTPEATFGLNLLALRTPVHRKHDVVTWAVDMVVETVKKLYNEQDSFAPRLELYLRLAARTLIPAGETLVDIPRLFEDRAFRAWCLSTVTPPLEAQRLRSRWGLYDRLRPVEQEQRIEALMNRIGPIIDSPLLSAIVGSKETTVPFDRILAGDSMLLVSLPSETLGSERCDFIGAMLLAELANRLFSRAIVKRTPPRLHLYVDEYQRFATSASVRFREEGRKYGLGVVLAHQNLHQITDERIRYASQGARTLIALAMARPDADRLAGEFPIKPREEWTEELRGQDGYEKATALSLTPALDILTRSPHSNPKVQEAAAMLFRPRGRQERWLPYTPTEEPQEYFQVTVDVFNDLLVRAMKKGAPGREALAKALWQRNMKNEGFHNGFYLHESSFYPSLNGHLYPRSEPGAGPGWRHSGILPEQLTYTSSDPPYNSNIRNSRESTRGSYNPSFNEHYVAYHNTQLDKLFAHKRGQFIAELEAWFAVHLDQLSEFLAGETPVAIADADERLVTYAMSEDWIASGTWEWIPESVRRFAIEKKPDAIRRNIFRRLSYTREHFVYHHRWLSIICDGLAADPVVVQSANEQPKMRTHYVTHSRQTVQDALNEFAGELVDPGEDFVAHVRMKHAYHRVKLADAVEPFAADGQIDWVRRRSLQEYHRPDLCSEEETPNQSRPSPPPARELEPPITRRPRAAMPNTPGESKEIGEDHGTRGTLF